jgi:hypothetical protein
MPEGKYLDRHRIGNHTVVQIVMDAVKMNTADIGKLDVPSLCPDRWLRCKELECALKLYGKCIWSLRPIGYPHSAASTIARAALLTMRTGKGPFTIGESAAGLVTRLSSLLARPPR